MEPGNTLDTTHNSNDCRAVADVLSRIGDKWTVYVVKLLGNGSMRFNEVRRAVPAISQRMLSLTLRGLERDGLVIRTVTPSIPPRVDYELSPMGLTLFEPLKAVGVWAISNREYVEKSGMQFDSRQDVTKAVPQRKRLPELQRPAAARQVPAPHTDV